jgi:hypothetical protein
VNEYQVIYLPKYDEIIVYNPMGMRIETSPWFFFPLHELNSGKLIQVVLGDL